MSSQGNSRREFIQTTLAGAAALGLTDSGFGTDDADSKGLPTRPLGKTGVRVSLFCLGGWHIGTVKEEKEAIRIMHAAIDEGLSFFDNAWNTTTAAVKRSWARRWRWRASEPKCSS